MSAQVPPESVGVMRQVDVGVSAGLNRSTVGSVGVQQHRGWKAAERGRERLR